MKLTKVIKLATKWVEFATLVALLPATVLFNIKNYSSMGVFEATFLSVVAALSAMIYSYMVIKDKKKEIYRELYINLIYLAIIIPHLVFVKEKKELFVAFLLFTMLHLIRRVVHIVMEDR